MDAKSVAQFIATIEGHPFLAVHARSLNVIEVNCNLRTPGTQGGETLSLSCAWTGIGKCAFSSASCGDSTSSRKCDWIPHRPSRGSSPHVLSPQYRQAEAPRKNRIALKVGALGAAYIVRAEFTQRLGAESGLSVDELVLAWDGSNSAESSEGLLRSPHQSGGELSFGNGCRSFVRTAAQLMCK
ncbi:hypothetical protein BV20DRAFT_361986 [Pilatotrama ljubarskyi]|nr:hypothetical protein BV20DRAFT_361986 [Pilatotrama ljubarskyi]